MRESGTNEGKSAKFMGLLVPNQRNIHAFISYMVPNRSDSEDILQDTLSEMWNKFDDYEEGTNFIAWGVAIARFKIMSHQKRYHKSKLRFDSHTLELLQTEAESEMKRNDLETQIDILRNCVKKLSEKEKNYLNLRYRERLTFQGIAERFGISMQGAYKAVALIHARLLKCVHLNMKTEGLR